MSSPARGTAFWSADPDLRAALYAWLAAALYAPQEDLVSVEFARCGEQLNASVLPGHSPLLLQRLREANQKPTAAAERLLALKREYARLFLGPPKALLRPYESCYFGRDQLMTEQSAAVRQFYTACGLTLDQREYREAPDHVSVELTFLSMICETGCTQLTQSQTDRRAVERRFLHEHLGRWGSQLAGGIRQHTDEPLYLAAAQFLTAVIDSCTSADG